MVSKTAVGGPQNFVANPALGKAISNHPHPRRLHMIALEAVLSNYTEGKSLPSYIVLEKILIFLILIYRYIEFKDFSERFKLDKIDLVICDSFAISCIDSAMYNKIPVVITSTFGISHGLYKCFRIHHVQYIAYAKISS